MLENIYQGRQTYTFSKNSNIPLKSQNIWILRQGLVLLITYHDDGSEAILGLAYPDMPFGLPLSQIDPYEAIALTDVVLMRFSQVEIEYSPVLAQKILFQLNRRVQQTEALLNIVHHRSVNERLQALLLLLARELGEQTPGGIRIGIRLTHQQIANLVGATRVTVSRVLGVFRKEGWLSVDKTRHVVIHNSAFGHR